MRSALKEFIAMVMLGGTMLSSGQQPPTAPEWQPSIAEDNKAATWEDTSKFIVNTISTSGKNYIVWNPPAPAAVPQTGRRSHARTPPAPPSKIVVRNEYEVTSDSRCMLYEKSYYYQNGSSGVVLEHINLGAIDPLSIKVKYNPGFAAYQITMSGTSQQVIDQYTAITRN